MHGALTDHPQPHTFWHTDSAGDPETRLRALGLLARQYGCTSVFFDRQPMRGPLGRRLRRLNCVLQVRYRERGGWLIRVINLRSTFEKLAPELSRRLTDSALASWHGTLLIANADERVLLHIDAGQVRVGRGDEAAHAIIGGHEIAQLIVGTDEPEGIVAAAGTQLTGDAPQLLRVPFPSQDPQMCNEDL